MPLHAITTRTTKTHWKTLQQRTIRSGAGAATFHQHSHRTTVTATYSSLAHQFISGKYFGAKRVFWSGRIDSNRVVLC